MNQALKSWVDECAALTKPDRVVWCDGSPEQNRRFVGQLVDDGSFIPLNSSTHPDCYLYRSDPRDVARTEKSTFICSRKEEDAGPTNNWMDPDEAGQMLRGFFDGSMRGRTMYVVPYCMGPLGSPLSKIGVELTDSLYVVVNMAIMTRMGADALEHLGDSEDFCRGLHGLGDMDPEKRRIMHFPETREIWSYGSGYGGNALLGKKCFALRIASVQGRDELWMAEHMLIVGVEDPKGEVTYIAAAFPSACGKTNLAMLKPPPGMEGWKVWTVGDDIAWMRVGEDGRLWAINPEAGFFGVVPGTSSKTNPNAMASIKRGAIFTNVALDNEGNPWWEGCDTPPPAHLTDWTGKDWTPDADRPAAHPNSRFTVSIRNCPTVSSRFDDPKGVPISAILFGGRRAKVAPLVYEAFDWNHGVFLGASMASETTAAATDISSGLRRDPMAMLPFCGYNMGDYWGHWLKMGTVIPRPPRIFHVNWFRRGEDGKFMWPGFGENLRVLQWVIARARGAGEARETPIGRIPAAGAIDTRGIDVDDATMEALLEVDPELYLQEAEDVESWFARFGDHLPGELGSQLAGLKKRLSGG